MAEEPAVLGSPDGIFCVDWGCSNLVMAKPVGTLDIDPLAFLFLQLGPIEPEGEACLERFLGVMDPEVL